MEWALHAVAVWVVFLILVDWKELKVNIWCGVFSVAIQLAVDTYAISFGLYKINNPVVSIWGSSIFFIFGPALFIGILISQFQPKKRWARITITVFLTTVYTIEEYLVAVRHALDYIRWNIGYSAVINFLVMMSLSWFAIIVLKRGSVKE